MKKFIAALIMVVAASTKADSRLDGQVVECVGQNNQFMLFSINKDAKRAVFVGHDMSMDGFDITFNGSEITGKHMQHAGVTMEAFPLPQLGKNMYQATIDVYGNNMGGWFNCNF